jgi:hypothetical protein
VLRASQKRARLPHTSSLILSDCPKQTRPFARPGGLTGVKHTSSKGYLPSLESACRCCPRSGARCVGLLMRACLALSGSVSCCPALIPPSNGGLPGHRRRGLGLPCPSASRVWPVNAGPGSLGRSPHLQVCDSNSAPGRTQGSVSWSLHRSGTPGSDTQPLASLAAAWARENQSMLTS